MSAPTILVEGNIAVGKSSILQQYSQGGLVLAIPEPVDQWRNAGGRNLLEDFYRDRKKHAFSFQSLVALTMIGAHRVPVKGHHRLKMMERSIWSSYNIFAKQLYNEGVLEPGDFSILTGYHREVCTWDYVQADKIIYIRASPEICFKRAQNRERVEETGLSLSYFETLHGLLDAWLMADGEDEERSTLARPNCPVIVVDGEKSQAEIMGEMNGILGLH